MNNEYQLNSGVLVLRTIVCPQRDNLNNTMHQQRFQVVQMAYKLLWFVIYYLLIYLYLLIKSRNYCVLGNTFPILIF